MSRIQRIGNLNLQQQRRIEIHCLRDNLLAQRAPFQKLHRSNKQAISYCGLCGEENSSADKVMRMPISKQRNKHLQHVLIEAAKLAPRESAELAMIRARELERGNPNRATLAVARKLVIYLLAVERRQQDWVPAEEFRRAAAA